MHWRISWEKQAKKQTQRNSSWHVRWLLIRQESLPIILHEWHGITLSEIRRLSTLKDMHKSGAGIRSPRLNRHPLGLSNAEHQRRPQQIPNWPKILESG